MLKPTLIVVSGRPGSGKTTLAHKLAEAVGCPAICRDELKQGMLYSYPGFRPAAGDALTTRTFALFFAVLEQLLSAEVTHVAEAAFQDHLWRPHLEQLAALADIRVIECTVSPDIAAARRAARSQASPIHRAAHAQHVPESFTGITLELPKLVVETTDGYRPDLGAMLAFLDLPPLGSASTPGLGLRPGAISYASA